MSSSLVSDGARATLMLRADAQPVLRRKRPAPHANVAALIEEIDCLLAGDVFFLAGHLFQMAAPIVGVNKSNGTLHLCADSSTGLDDALMLHQHPLPTPDDVFTKLNGGTVFTQLDIADAYLQVEVDENSKELLTINTHRGLFRYDRLPFGVKSAPGIFQQIIDSMIAGLGGCAAYFDDVIVTGRLESLFRRIQEYGFRVRIEKYNPAKLEVVKKMPPAKDIGQVRSLLGLLNHYGAFVEEMRQLRAPLDNLLKKDTLFNWTADSQQAFNRAKEVLSSDLLLTHFDPTKEIVVAADALEHGVGAVISRRFLDGSEKPIYYACRALTAAENNCGQVEKESLALVYAVRKIHRYLYGREFKLLIDHKPLLTISSKKGIIVYMANRLQRWTLILLNYNFSCSTFA
ncbi:hypothetical protein Y032_0094g2695 [Ancylostoma ceylanicum]|uniref:RNA-directed DNA polymerase n=1 Tax=Ancylostoma ceylanicum TaxID=53326 RepID=A0A016TK04_9BILA|nr:hypothetical protein Y032_0094g2695 [Ancylostoma ceylanicum]